MELIDYSEYIQNTETYGGAAGKKVGITISGKRYLLKFPQNLKGKEMKNIELSYSNSPVSEFIGSQIYNMLDIPVQQTALGIRNGKTVVCCKDIREIGEELVEFGDLKVTYEPVLVNSAGVPTDGTGTDISDTLEVIRYHPLISNIPGVEERFWDMFVVDALIGNTDRNNGNWGFIRNADADRELTELAPVYDNGNCMNNKWDDNKFHNHIADDRLMASAATNGVVCAFTYNKGRINPYQLMASEEFKECNDAVIRIAPRIQSAMSNIMAMVEDLCEANIISEVKAKFITSVLNTRFDYVRQIYKDLIAKRSYNPEY